MKKLLAVLAAMLTFASTAFAEIGSLDKDLVYTPVTPCRIMDTRNPGSKSGILAAGSVRGFWGWNNTFASQGGSATSCGTLNSTNQAAILVNFTVVTPDTGGYITAFPADVLDANKPLAATVNFNAGSVVGNNATVKLNQTGSGDDFKIYSTSNVHVVADIVGFYSKPIATAQQCVEVVSTGVDVASGGTGTQTTPACSAGYSIAAGGCSSSTYDGRVVTTRTQGIGTANQYHFCAFRNEGASTANFIAYASCCRVPGR
jgi:hypothetical protein